MSSGDTHPIPGGGIENVGLYLNVGLIQRQSLAANRGSA